MSVNGFNVNGNVIKYNYEALDNKPVDPPGNFGITEKLRAALLQLAEKVAYIDGGGQDYYQDLYDALRIPAAPLSSISAVYTQSGTVYNTDTLASLRNDLVVTAHYQDNTTQVVTTYVLNGTLTAGTSTITVIYGDKETTFTVTVTAAPTMYSITNTLTDVENNNAASNIAGNSAYSAELVPAHSDYTITTITVTMGGTDITSTAYSDGAINIASVTGNVVITAAATQRVASLSSISAVFTQGSAEIYTSDSLDVLKQYLAVTATWSDSSTSAVAAADYTLSGTLAEGTSTITVSYGGKTDTFTVTVTAYTPQSYSLGGPTQTGAADALNTSYLINGEIDLSSIEAGSNRYYQQKLSPACTVKITTNAGAYSLGYYYCVINGEMYSYNGAWHNQSRGTSQGSKMDIRTSATTPGNATEVVVLSRSKNLTVCTIEEVTT